jgi:hypothetical protein
MSARPQHLYGARTAYHAPNAGYDPFSTRLYQVRYFPKGIVNSCSTSSRKLAESKAATLDQMPQHPLWLVAVEAVLLGRYPDNLHWISIQSGSCRLSRLTH